MLSGDPMAAPTLVEIVIANPGSSITASVSDGMGACPFPTSMRLFTQDLFIVGTAFSNGACASIDPLTDDNEWWAGNLLPGNYLLAVGADSETDMGMGNVQVMIGGAQCGNGLAETNANEECDDGGTANGDGCNNMCNYEGNVTLEIEPNNDNATATPVAVTPGNTVSMVGTIAPEGDHDVYSFMVPANGSVVAKTYPTFEDPASCGTTVDTVVFLLDSTGMIVASNDDLDISNSEYCSLIDATTDPGSTMLPAGMYFLDVQHFADSDVIRTYFFDITVSP